MSGRIAYEAYRDAVGATLIEGRTWEHLSPVEREAWRAAADAVRMWEHLHRPDNPAHERSRLPGMTTVAYDASVDRVSSPPGSRRIEPPFATRAGDQIGLNDRVFRVWRDGELVADYAAGDDGVLRPVTS